MVTSTDGKRPRFERWRRVVVDLPVGRKLLVGLGSLTAVLVLVIGCLFLTVARLGSANHELVDVAAARAQGAAQLRFAAADACSNLEQAVRLADNALYEAKAGGRDRTTLATIDAEASADRGNATGRASPNAPTPTTTVSSPASCAATTPTSRSADAGSSAAGRATTAVEVPAGLVLSPASGARRP